MDWTIEQQRTHFSRKLLTEAIQRESSMPSKYASSSLCSKRWCFLKLSLVSLQFFTAIAPMNGQSCLEHVCQVQHIRKQFCSISGYWHVFRFIMIYLTELLWNILKKWWKYWWKHSECFLFHLYMKISHEFLLPIV